MIKAKGTANGKPLLILGLSGENITRLVAKEPIRFNSGELGLPPMEVVILAGRTEQDIVDALRVAGLIGPDTIQHGVLDERG